MGGRALSGGASGEGRLERGRGMVGGGVMIGGDGEVGGGGLAGLARESFGG